MLKVIVTAVFAAAVPFASALAADMPVPVMPAPVAPVSSWYLRGDVGVGAVHADGVTYLPNPNNNPSDFTIQSVGIGDQAFLNAGIGYGGSCFPKDISAFIRISRELGYEFTLLEEVERINANQKERFLKKIREALWVLRQKKIGVLGLAFKGNTDDVRSSVAIGVVQQLLAEGAEIRAYDPKAMDKAKSLVPGAIMVDAPEKVAEGADALLILTEWVDFKSLPYAAMKKSMLSPLLFDGRNLLDPVAMRALGFTYTGIGH